MGATILGALNVYGFERPDAFSPAARRQLELFAAQAAGTMRVATRQIKDGQLLEQMEGALRSRTVIDQAMGIIMGQQRCTADVAFGLLRHEARSSRRTLRGVAGDHHLRAEAESRQGPSGVAHGLPETASIVPRPGRIAGGLRLPPNDHDLRRSLHALRSRRRR